MASINDLATAATIASSAVALQSSPSRDAAARAAGQSTTPPRSPSPHPGTASGSASGPGVEASLAQLQRFVKGDVDVDAPEDADSITVATGAAPPPPSVLAAPQIEPAQIPVPPPAAAAAAAEAGEDAEMTGEGDAEGKGVVSDAMDGVENEGSRPVPVRGAFVVFEGMDRAGKTTQAKLLQQRCIESGREARFMRFPGKLSPAETMRLI